MIQTIRGIALLAGLTAFMPASAQNVIKLFQSDIYFQWRPMPKGSAVCGYNVLGNRLSHDNPKIEWDTAVHRHSTKKLVL